MSTLAFGPFCPLGGSFYACSGPTAKSKFVGCCDADPCGSTVGCTAGNLRPASYNASAHGTFADQECSAGLYYTCSSTSPPFMGCCKSNPCGRGSCPQTDLAGAFLSGDPAKAGDFLPAGAKASSTATLAGTSSGTALPGITVTSSNGLSTGAIVGLVVGVVVVLLILTGALFFVCGKRSKEKKAKREATFEPVSQTEQPYSPPMESAAFRNSVQKGGAYSPYTDNSGFPSPAPQYYAPGSDGGMPSPPPAFDPRYSSSQQSPDPRALSPHHAAAGIAAAPDAQHPLIQHTAFELDAAPQATELIGSPVLSPGLLPSSPAVEIGESAPSSRRTTQLFQSDKPA